MNVVQKAITTIENADVEQYNHSELQSCLDQVLPLLHKRLELLKEIRSHKAAHISPEMMAAEEESYQMLKSALDQFAALFKAVVIKNNLPGLT